MFIKYMGIVTKIKKTLKSREFSKGLIFGILFWVDIPGIIRHIQKKNYFELVKYLLIMLYSISYITDNEKDKIYLSTNGITSVTSNIIGFLLKVFIKDLDPWKPNTTNDNIESNFSVENYTVYIFTLLSLFIILASNPETIQLNFIYRQMFLSLIFLILNLVFVKSKLQGEETRILYFTEKFDKLHKWDKYYLLRSLIITPIVNYLVISNLQKWIH